jgi:ADP-ribose pyrophosphatase
LEVGEAPQVGALREIREEIGMSAGSLRKIGGFFLAPGYSTEYMHIFLATHLYADALPGDVDEFLSVEKIPISQAFELAQNGQIQDAKSLTALFLAQPYITV